MVHHHNQSSDLPSTGRSSAEWCPAQEEGTLASTALQGTEGCFENDSLHVDDCCAFGSAWADQFHQV